MARLSGDEFAMCLPGLSAGQAEEVAHRVLTTLERPLQMDDQTIDVTGSIGLAVSPEYGDDAGLLLSRAEVAMYAAKASRLGVRAFDPSLDSSSASSLFLLTELRAAVDGNQLQVYLQPKVRLSDGEVVGAEALVRWEHPERGLRLGDGVAQRRGHAVQLRRRLGERTAPGDGVEGHQRVQR
jgi:predicted signal transduction protein with EAL and GGDEF domain